MKFGIGAKLGLLVSVLLVFTVLVLAWWMMGWSRETLTRHELLALADETLLRGGELIHNTQILREDALQQAGRTSLQEYLQAPANRRPALGKEIEDDFRTLLTARRRNYLQIEYLPAEGSGRDPVAFDNVEKEVRVNSAAHHKYFDRLDKVRDNAVRVSRVRCNADVQEKGRPIPVLRAAAPLFVNDGVGGPGRYAGALIITLDFRPLAKSLTRSARYLTYLTDEQGHFLVHPDADQEFVFEKDPHAPRIFDELMPGLERLYRPDDATRGVTVGTGSASPVRARGFRYPEKPEPWALERPYFMLDLEAITPEQWKEEQKEQERLAGFLEKLPKRYPGLAVSGVSPLELATTLRSQKEDQLTRASQEILDQFGASLQARKPVECRTFAVHFYRLAYSPPGVDPPRWVGLAHALSHQEIVADVNEQTTGLFRLKLGLIVLGVGLAFLLSRRLTRPLHRITEATRGLAQGDFEVDLPIQASDEIGVLARCFKDMVEQLRQRGRELRDNEARMRTILRTAAEGIFILDEEGRIQMVNQAAEQLFGYRAAELIDQNVKLLIPKEVQGLPREGQKRPADIAGSTIKLGRVSGSTQEAIGQRKDGSTFPLELSVSDVPVGDQRLFTGIVRDIAERKKAEEEIRALNQHLQDLNEQLDGRVRERTSQLQKTNEELAVARDEALEASRAKSSFLATMSHELRTPLKANKGYSEMLLEEVQDRSLDDLVPDLNKIIEAGKHLLALINDVLDLSKIEANKVELYLESFDVKTLVEGTVSTLAPLVKKNNNSLSVRCPEGIGPMFADRTRVRQVLFNLLSNAAKFTHAGRIELEVVREVWSEREAVSFHIRDTGIGISPEQLKRLFQPFMQGDDSTTRKYGGTGLGLVISRSFCVMMGGDLTVRSEPGKGSVFSATFPVQLADSRASAPSRPLDGETRGSETVLVIDDDPAVRELMQRYLDKEGFRAITAANGQEGLRLARQLQPVAITLDVLMPGMGGWEVLGALKADPGTASIPVIMLTNSEDRNRGQALGAAEYVTKPIDRDRLMSLLRKYRGEVRAKAGAPAS